MSALDRMTKERDRLLSEASKLTSAIDLINKFKEVEAPEKKVAKTRKRSPRNGLSSATKEAVRLAIGKYGRPVTPDEILEFVTVKGFTKQDVENSRLSKLIYPDFCGEGGGKALTTIWYKNKPRPEKEAWKQELEKIV